MTLVLGVLIFGIAICGIAGAWFWLRLFLHRREGRKPMARYADYWKTTRA